MINNQVGVNIDHITTSVNAIADRISCIKKETNVLPDFKQLMQDFPQLTSCSPFHPIPESVSYVTAALLHEKLFKLLNVATNILDNLGKNITLDSAN